MQSISIRNLGPIKEFDSEIKDLTLLIGAQGTGKSTIAKAVFFFRTVRDIILEEMDGALKMPPLDYSWDNLTRNLVSKLTGYFDFEYTAGLEKIEFHFDGGASIKIYSDKDALDVEYSKEFRHRINSIFASFSSMFSAKYEVSGDGEEVRNYVESKRHAMFWRNEELDRQLGFVERNIFLPAGRARYSSFDDRVAYFRSKKKNLIVDQLVNEIEEVRAYAIKEGPRPLEVLFSPTLEMAIGMAKEILLGELKQVDEIDRFFFSEKRSLPIEAISSGQQEALWVVNLLVSMIRANYQRFFLVIEEPEAHLHPSAQYLLCKLIVLAMKAFSSKILITTHSPYILASINNMLLGAKVGKEKPEEAAEILPEEFWIDHTHVFAGEVKDGRVEDIINRDLAMIKVERIDTVTENINDVFDRLTDLEDVPMLEDHEIGQGA